jgi:hypothetical protein
MADQQDRPEPDHAEDPRKTGYGEGGYPEENPAGSESPEGPGARRDDEPDAGDDAPGTSSPSESSPGTATGKPDAAGG